MEKQNIEDDINNYFQKNDKNNISSHISSGVCKCTIRINNFLFVVDYEIIDNFYKYKIESNDDYIFLTKSKRFKKQLISFIKNNKDNKHDIKSHIKAIYMFINMLMDNKTNFEK